MLCHVLRDQTPMAFIRAPFHAQKTYILQTVAREQFFRRPHRQNIIKFAHISRPIGHATFIPGQQIGAGRQLRHRFVSRPQNPRQVIPTGPRGKFRRPPQTHIHQLPHANRIHHGDDIVQPLATNPNRVNFYHVTETIPSFGLYQRVIEYILAVFYDLSIDANVLNTTGLLTITISNLFLARVTA